MSNRQPIKKQSDKAATTPLPAKKAPRFAIDLDHLDVGTVLSVFREQVCDDANYYLKYGANLRAAYTEIRKEPDHWETISKLLRIPQYPAPAELLAAMQPFFTFSNNFTSTALEEIVCRRMGEHIKISAINQDLEFNVFMKALVREITKYAKGAKIPIKGGRAFK